MFRVGDRVVMTHNYSKSFDGALGTVGKVTDEIICVRFDDPSLEKLQSYESGWYPKRFTLLPNDSEEMIYDV